MTYIRRGRYVHDTNQYGREVLQGSSAFQFAAKVGEAAHGVFLVTVPRDDNDWANSVTVHTSVQDRNGKRVVTVLRSSDPHAREKEFGHVVETRRRKGERTNRKGRIGPLRRGFTYRFVPGAHTMTKAMAGVTGGRARVRRGRR